MFLKLLLLFYICSIAQTADNEEQTVGNEYVLSTSFDLLEEARSSKNITENDLKNILRYGFHKTEECREFKLVYVCIRKCLDLNYDVAHADKHCKCRCFKKPGKDPKKDKMTIETTATLWKEGAPTTKLPYWILNLEKLKKGNESIPVDEESEDDEGEGSSVGEDNNAGNSTVVDESLGTGAGNETVSASEVSAAGNETSTEAGTGGGNATESVSADASAGASADASESDTSGSTGDTTTT